MVKITLEQVRAAVKEVVEEEGADHYAECYYSVEGLALHEKEGWISGRRAVPTASTPMCVVGQVVTKIQGLPGLRNLLEGLNVVEQESNFSGMGYTDAAIQYLQAVQIKQDDHESWGAAVEYGEYLIRQGAIKETE